MTEDYKKEILTSDEKGAAKSTLGGAVAGAVVGTAVSTPVWVHSNWRSSLFELAPV